MLANRAPETSQKVCPSFTAGSTLNGVYFHAQLLSAPRQNQNNNDTNRNVALRQPYVIAERAWLQHPTSDSEWQ